MSRHLRKPGALSRAALALSLCLAGGFSGCLFDSSPRSASGGGGWDDFPNRLANSCGDITPAQMAAADTLVAQGSPYLTQESNFFLSDTTRRWNEIKSRDVTPLKTYYGGARAAAPNHCGALFGDAVATALGVVREGALDSLVREAQHTQVGAPGLMKLSAEEAAPALIELRSALAASDKSLLTLTQQVGETILLPRVDSAIAALEKVMANKDFRFTLVSQGKTYTLDRGEVGPLLAGLKVVKAALYVIVGYRWATETGDDYPYYSVLKGIHDSDLDHLSLEQKAALDYYTGLFKADSGFAHIRAGWAPRVASIPTLLLQAIDHTEEGLRYGLYQADSNRDQSHDPYRVGGREGDDLDTADVRLAIERLERVKPYLAGVVPLSYASGTETLRINIPKFFAIDGFQKLLPYFEFHPYPKWNDTVPGDSVAYGPIYFTDAAGNPTLEGHDLGKHLDSLEGLKGLISFPDPTFGGVFPDFTNDNLWSKVASLAKVRSRVTEECSSDGLTETCRPILPAGPSDLDLLVYYLSRAPRPAAGP